MSKRILSYRPSHTTVVAYLALFVALGGSAYAATRIGSRQIVNNSIRSQDIRNGQVTNRDVRNGSLLAADFGPGQLPAGPQGATGSRGGPGPPGARGTFGTVTVRSTQYTSGEPATASCESGEVAIGGGVSTVQNNSFIRVSEPSPGHGQTPTGWAGQTLNTSNAAVPGGVWVVCARR